MCINTKLIWWLTNDVPRYRGLVVPLSCIFLLDLPEELPQDLFNPNLIAWKLGRLTWDQCLRPLNSMEKILTVFCFCCIALGNITNED